MTTSHPSAASTANAPRLDMPNLGVHALWFAWFATLLATWPDLGPWARFGLVALGLPVNFWGYAVLHNHMHLSIARPKVLHWIVSRTLGFSVGFAYRGFHMHHFNHHKHSNGPLDWGHFEQGESVLLYALRNTLQAWNPAGPLMGHLFAVKKHRAELVLDLLLVDGGIVALIAWRPAMGLAYFAVVLATQACIFYINYAAHDQTDANDRARLAVTSTSRVYNTLFFNAGYHQAHHLKPQAYWRSLPALTDELAREGLVAPDLVTPLSPAGATFALRVVGRTSAKKRASVKECSP